LIRFVNDDLKAEAGQFVKEQRIRCLLEGAWFPSTFSYAESGPVTKHNVNQGTASSWRFVRLSHNRRWLHYADFEKKRDPAPGLDELNEKRKSPFASAHQWLLTLNLVDLSIVSSVVSNISSSPPSSPDPSASSTDMLARTNKGGPVGGANTNSTSSSAKITVYGYLPASATPASPRRASAAQNGTTTNGGNGKESVLLQLHPGTKTVASEWVDGLLMLLNQRPITAETERLEETIANYGLRIRLLNIRYEDLNAAEPRNPSREGLDEDYWYDFGGL
jgi:engulfment/cell motility protein 1